MRIVYLHGFASSPQSSKARFFQRKFTEAGIPFLAPQLDRNDFERLTITGMLQVIAATVADEKTVLMGSSLGGFVAGLYAARYPDPVEKLVLLAPAFQFSERWKARFNQEQFAAWKTRGWAPFFHYAAQKEERLAYGFVEDAESYESEPDFHQPALILHGSTDPVVPVEISRAFAARHSNVKLVEYASGHELTDLTEPMWEQTASFLHVL
jgi:pimeloyl-ACP methyl ester carboxylesterase